MNAHLFAQWCVLDIGNRTAILYNCSADTLFCGQKRTGGLDNVRDFFGTFLSVAAPCKPMV